MRILISAYYCSPYRGGESAVGWQVATELANHHDVTVVCGDLSAGATTGNDIARYRAEHGLPAGLEIQHVQLTGLGRTIHDLHGLPGLWFLYYEAYRRWQKQILRVVRDLHADKPFDLIHHVNIIGFREPGYLWQLGIPFFWGPVSGAPMVPPAFLKDFSPKERFRWGTRNFLNKLQIRLARRQPKAARAAAKVWAVSAEDCATLARWSVGAEPMLETGCTPSHSGEIKQRAANDPLRLCWSGLFQGIKTLPVLLRAMAASNIHQIQLDVLGHGPEAERWKSLASELGLDGRISWHGMLPRDKALAVMRRSHALVHTSVKEGTPHVVLEALAMGLPVLCHDACGMGIAVTPGCGIKMPLDNPASSIYGFRDAMERLYSEPGLLEILSRGAMDRAKELTWDMKIQRFSQAYREATQP